MDAAGLEAGALDAGLEVGLAAAVIFLVAFFLAVAFLDPVVAAFLAVFFFAATFLTFFFVVRVPEADGCASSFGVSAIWVCLRGMYNHNTCE